MTVSVVQTADGFASSATSVTSTTSSSTTAGNWLIGIVWHAPTTTVSGISGGGTWTQYTTTSNSDRQIDIWSNPSCTAATSFTTSWSASDSVEATIVELSGVGMIWSNAPHSATATTSDSIAGLTVPSPMLCIAVLYPDQYTTDTGSGTISGWTNIVQRVFAPSNVWQSAWYQQAATGSTTSGSLTMHTSGNDLSLTLGIAPVFQQSAIL